MNVTGSGVLRHSWYSVLHPSMCEQNRILGIWGTRAKGVKVVPRDVLLKMVRQPVEDFLEEKEPTEEDFKFAISE